MSRERHFGHAAHFICAQWCRFHMATQVGRWLVSTVGEYWPERSSRKIHATVHDPAWLAANQQLRGDDFDAAYMKRFGYEEIGYRRTYETMVFRVGPPCSAKGCGCGLPSTDGIDLDCAGYTNAKDATLGHRRMVRKWAKRRKPAEPE